MRESELQTRKEIYRIHYFTGDYNKHCDFILFFLLFFLIWKEIKRNKAQKCLKYVTSETNLSYCRPMPLSDLWNIGIIIWRLRISSGTHLLLLDDEIIFKEFDCVITGRLLFTPTLNKCSDLHIIQFIEQCYYYTKWTLWKFRAPGSWKWSVAVHHHSC